jgi:hypothetical protein
MKAYFQDKELIKKKWYGNEYKYSYIEVDVLGKQIYRDNHLDIETIYYLIKLPDGIIKEAKDTEMYFSPFSKEL